MKKRIPYPRWHQNAEIIEFIADFERSHLRTREDTGADPGAMFLWNLVRIRAGLPGITIEDLPKYDFVKAKYVLPRRSKLTGVSL